MTKDFKLYSKTFDANSGQFITSYQNIVITFKDTVATQSALPTTNNTLYDARIALDLLRIHIWTGSEWSDQGVYDTYRDVTTESIPGPDGQPTISKAFGTYYFTDDTSGIGGYGLIAEEPKLPNPINDTVSIINETKYFPKVFATPPLSTTSIPAGSWALRLFRNINTSAGNTFITVEVYKRDLNGTETFLFDFQSADINDPTSTLEQIIVTQPIIYVDTTDRLVIKVKAQTTNFSNTVVQYFFGGTTSYSHIFKY